MVRNSIASGLAIRGHSVYFYASENFSIGDLRDADLSNLIRIYTINTRIKYSIGILQYVKLFKNRLREDKLDILIFFGSSFIEQVVARGSNIKVVTSERKNPRSQSLFRKLIRLINFSIADSCVFQLPGALDFYPNCVKKKSVIIPNPIKEGLPDPKVDNPSNDIVTVGRLSKEKNQIGIIQAFNIIAQKYPDYKLKIFGDGDLRSRLAELINSYHLENKVQIIGGRYDIPEQINGASIFILNSNTEGIPNALLEAMSLGIACISTDCPIGGPAFLINNELNGLLIPVNNVQKLVEAIEFLIVYELNFYQIRRSSIKIRKKFSKSLIIDKWVTFLYSVIRKLILSMP